MKRKISDILDCYGDSGMELAHDAPLSSERIKELTMNKIINKRERKNRRTGFRVLVAAAVIAALTVTAVAAEEFFSTSDWFRDILNHNLKDDRVLVQKNELELSIRETVSEGQLEVIDHLGESFQPQSYTADGTTMTLSAAYGDAHVIHLYFQVEAPEGTVLPDGILYQINNMEEDFNGDGHADLLTLAEDAPYQKTGHFMDIEALPDENPADNKKEFHVTLTCQPGFEMAFNDGVTKYLHVNGIFEQVVDANGDEDAFVLLALADFAFDIGLVNEMRIVELDVDGLTYGGHASESWTHDSPCQAFCAENLTGETDPETGLPVHAESWEYYVTVKSLSISELSADWTCEWICDDEQKGFSVSFKVVLKDGTTVLKEDVGGWFDTNSSRGTMLFTTPIDLDEVDYILIGDESIGSTHKVYLPE